MADPTLHRPVTVTSLSTGASIEECAACLDPWPCDAVLGDVQYVAPPEPLDGSIPEG